MEAASYGSPAMDDNAVRKAPSSPAPRPQAGTAYGCGERRPAAARAGASGRGAGEGRVADAPEAGAAAVGRRRDAVVAAERLGELRRLAVADAAGDLADG